MNGDFYIQDYIGIKSCENGIIETNDGQYYTFHEVMPINFSFQTDKEKEIILDYFARYLKVSPIKLRIKTLSKRTDTDKYIKTLWGDYKKEPDERCREFQKNNIEFIRALGTNEGVSHRFFVIFKYENKRATTDRDDIEYWFQKAEDVLRQSLVLCGNDIINHRNRNEFVIETFYLIMNRSKSVSDFDDRIVELYNTAYDKYGGDTEKLLNLELNVGDIISPHRIEIFAKYMVVDDTYYSFLYLPSASYQTFVTSCWASGLINACEGVDIDFFIERKDTSSIRPSLKRALRLNRLKLNSTEDSKDSFDEISNAYQSAAYIKERLANRENFFYFSTLVTISADSVDALDEKVGAIELLLDTNDFTTKSCQNRMLQTFKMYMPTGELDKSLYNKSRRNVTTNGLSALYPFTSFEVSDEDGILIGINQVNDSLCVIDNFNTHVYNNANICILGTSGSGKTFLLQLLAMRWRMRDIPVYIIAPLKGHEFRDMCSNIGGQFVTLSSGSADRINIFEIRPVNKEKTIRASKDEIEESILAEKIAKLSTFMKLLIPTISLKDERRMDDALIETYNRKGITRDNESLILKRWTEHDSCGDEVEKYQYKPMPTMTDLYTVLDEADDTKHLAELIKIFVTGTSSNFNGETNVNLDSKMTVIDVSKMSDDYIPVGMFVAFDFIWDKVKEDITKKKVVIIDEAWLLMNKNPLAANFVLEAFKAIRGYGGAAVVATQDINDFYAYDAGKYGKAVINNSQIKFLLALKEDEADAVKTIFKLTDEEQKQIMMFPRGTGMIFSNRSSFVCDFKASSYERNLITTDRAELEEIKRQSILNGFTEKKTS